MNDVPAHLAAKARRECEVANELGRRYAERDGDWEGRAWLHPDDWVRMRSPLAILTMLVFADGEVTDRENEALDGWVKLWLERSRWGDLYTDSKLRAINLLCMALQTDLPEILECAHDCAARLSERQRSALLECVEGLMPEIGDAGRRIERAIHPIIATFA